MRLSTCCRISGRSANTHFVAFCVFWLNMRLSTCCRISGRSANTQSFLTGVCFSYLFNFFFDLLFLFEYLFVGLQSLLAFIASDAKLRFASVLELG